MNLDTETSKKIEELQHLESHLQGILSQIQSISLEQNEINNAILELNKLTSEEEVYKISFGIMIKSSREVVLKELKEKIKIIENKLSTIEKQQSLVEKNISRLKEEINNSFLKKNKQP